MEENPHNEDNQHDLSFFTQVDALSISNESGSQLLPNCFLDDELELTIGKENQITLSQSQKMKMRHQSKVLDEQMGACFGKCNLMMILW